MDPDQFDALVKRLIAGQNRRQALTGAVSGALSTLGITVVAESRRKRAQRGSDDRGKRKRVKHRQDHGERQSSDSPKRLARSNHKRKHEKHKKSLRGEKKKKKKKHKRIDRCKKNGQPCVRDSKCCSKHCDPTSGTCTRLPAS